MTVPEVVAQVGRPSGVVFDCDGLLVDTEPSWERAEVEMYRRRGLEYGPAKRARFIGISVYAASALMAEDFGEQGREADLLAELLEDVVESITSEATALPGAVELVAAVAATGVPLAVASNSPLDIVQAALRRGGLLDAVGTVVSIEDVEHAKPAPDLYVVACSRLGADPARAVAFEDTVTGLTSARSAGLTVLGVPSLPVPFDADWVLGSLADPALTEWLATW